MNETIFHPTAMIFQFQDRRLIRILEGRIITGISHMVSASALNSVPLKLRSYYSELVI